MIEGEIHFTTEDEPGNAREVAVLEARQEDDKLFFALTSNGAKHLNWHQMIDMLDEIKEMVQAIARRS
jgi:hypothetical protein